LESRDKDTFAIETALTLLRATDAYLSAMRSNISKVESLVRRLSNATSNRSPSLGRQSWKTSTGTKAVGTSLPEMSRNNSRKTRRSKTHRDARANRNLERLQPGSGASENLPSLDVGF